MTETFAIVYDLRAPSAWRLTRYHRDAWGWLYTDIHPLDTDHIALVFRTSGERWRAWEPVRLEWILEEGSAAG